MQFKLEELTKAFANKLGSLETQLTVAQVQVAKLSQENRDLHSQIDELKKDTNEKLGKTGK